MNLPADTQSEALPARGLRSIARSNEAQARLHAIDPGGAHTYARGSDPYPEDMAPVLVRGHGARVDDLDGNTYVEYGMGLRPVKLGQGYGPVVTAAAEAPAGGVSFSRPSVWELRAAETFLALTPGAEVVKFAKNASDATTAAAEPSRAVTERPMIALCSTYRAPDDHRPVPLQRPQLADQDGFVLIFDEMSTGMRWSASGAQSVYGVTPDLSTWGRALGNGSSISALAGLRCIMECAGPNTEAWRVILLSMTDGPEVMSLEAYLAVAEAYQEHDVVGVVERRGGKLADAVNRASRAQGLQDYVAVYGRSSCLIYTTNDYDGRPSQFDRTLFLQELLDSGVLAKSFVVYAAHTDEDMAQTVDVATTAVEVSGQATGHLTTEGWLRPRPVAPALRKCAAPRHLAQ